MCTRAFPWQWQIFQPLVTRIQFAYRMLLPASVMLSLSGGLYLTALLRKRNPVIPLALLAVFCFFTTAFPILNEARVHRTVLKTNFVMQDNRVSGAEYLPVGLDRDYPGVNVDTVRLAEADVPLNITSHKREKLGFRFDYELPEDCRTVHFSVPLIYYTGFRGTLTAEDGTVLTPEIGWDQMGLVSLSNEGLSRGSISVSYQKTLPQHVGEIMSLLSIIFLLFIWRKRHTSAKFSS